MKLKVTLLATVAEREERARAVPRCVRPFLLSMCAVVEHIALGLANDKCGKRDQNSKA